MKKFLIFSSGYNEFSGGVIVLHKLCHLLNSLGYESYLYPLFQNYETNKNNFFEVSVKLWGHYVINKLKRYRINSAFNTPIFKAKMPYSWDEWVVVYPERVFGNPLGAKNIVRWFLHQPGFHSNKIYYGKGELYFDFSNFGKKFFFPGSKLSKNKLYVSHFPLEIYNLKQALVSNQRSGTAYSLRKGKHKKIIHDLNNSILIDGKSHEEIADIFKKVGTFISYDAYTAYSVFAVLCGAKSIVVPDEGVSIDEWYPNIKDRAGIAYGFDDAELKRANETSGQVLENILKEERHAKNNVKKFVEEVSDYFNDYQ